MDNMNNKIEKIEDKVDNIEKKIEDKMDNMDGVLRSILDLMTQGSTPAPSPVPSSDPVTSCVDTPGRFWHNGSRKQWCKIVQNANNARKTCDNNELNNVCPVSCGKCTP